MRGVTSRHHIEAPWHHPRAALVPAAAGLVTGLAVAVGLPPRHVSTASLAVGFTAEAGALSPSTAAEMLRRRLPAIRQRLAEPGLLEGVAPDAVVVRAAGGDRIEIRCVDSDPARAASLANRLAAHLVAQEEARRPADVTDGSEDLERQVAEARAALTATEEALRREGTPGAGGPANPGVDAAALRRLRAERGAVAASLQEAQARLDDLRRTPEATPSPDPELVRLRQELATLRTRYTDQHPDVQAVMRRIAEREAAAGGPAGGPPGGAAAEARGAEAEVASLSERVAWLDAQISRRSAEAQGDRKPGRGERLAALDRERARLQEAYQALLRKQAETRLDALRRRGRPGETFRVAEPARPAAAPSFPSPHLLALACVLAGVAAGLAAAVVAEDRTSVV